MAESNAERLRAAYERWKQGDVDGLVDLMHPGLDWRGLERGILWWRRAPS